MGAKNSTKPDGRSPCAAPGGAVLIRNPRPCVGMLEAIAFNQRFILRRNVCRLFVKLLGFGGPRQRGGGCSAARDHILHVIEIAGAHEALMFHRSISLVL